MGLRGSAPLSFWGGLVLASAAMTGLARTAGPDERGQPSWVDRRVEAWKITADERRFDEIGWATRLTEALRLSRAHRRPVFLFTHDGRINVGRC